MGMIPYDAVDLPRRDRVVVAHHGQLETCPYEVVWDGTPHRPLGSMLSVPKHETKPAPPLDWFDTRRDESRRPDRARSTQLQERVERVLERGLPMHTRDIARALRVKREQVHEAVKRLMRHGRVVVVDRQAGRGRPDNVYALAE